MGMESGGGGGGWIRRGIGGEQAGRWGKGWE